jgi:hypothetical protein
VDTFDGKVDVAKPRSLRRYLPIVEITLARAFRLRPADDRDRP